MPLGSVFGKYNLVAALGRGGTADVYLAAMRGPAGFQKLVVVKRLRADVADDARFRSMLLDEARLAARLHHPNVVQTLEVGEEAGSYFLTMEYLDGQPLNRVLVASLERKAPLEDALSVRVISDTLAGLHHAHELRDYNGAPLGLVHRDVSPQNIFITYEGEVKLVDFGIAKAAESTVTTETGELKGKLAYMAPEQAMGAPLDRRVDVFAAGIVLWELLTRQRLFSTKHPTHTLRLLLERPIPPVTEIVPGVAPELAAIVARALEREPAARFQTAAEMREALEHHLERALGRSPRREELGARIAALFETERAEVNAKVQAFMRDLGNDVNATGMPAADISAAFGALPRLLPPSLDSDASPRSSEYAPTRVETAGPAIPPSRAPNVRWIAFSITGAAVVLVAAVLFVFLQFRRSTSVRDAGAHAGDSAVVPEGDVVLRFAGSNTVGSELAPAIVEAFFAHRGAPNVSRRAGDDPRELYIVATQGGAARPQLVAIRAEGTATAFDGLVSGACDVGMASRAINDEEAARLAAAGLGDMRSPASEHVIGLDGVAVVVHPNSRVRTLDANALARVFSGEARDWAALGGAPGPIHLFARDDKSGTFDTFKHIILGSRALSPDAVRVADSAALSDKVAGDPAAIGIVGLAYVRSAKAIGVNQPGTAPMIPSAFTVSTESYLLSRRLYFYTSSRGGGPLAQELVSFALSPAGQAVVRAQGFVDLDVGEGEHQACGPRCPPRYLALTRNARRLSLDFRFRSGSNDLDSRAMRDVDRLVTFLRNRRSGKLLLFGFSDAVGDSAVNVRLSRERAEAINRELATRGVRAAAVEGFGSELPVGSNEEPSGREKNRRVEAWLVD